MNELTWSFSQIWNKSLEENKDRPMRARSNMWASELGGSYIDRYLKMTGEEPTNPPNARSLRKFEAGNLMEWVVGLVLKRAGILLDAQEWLSFQYNDPTLLEVTGKLDYLAGGRPDWEKGKNEIKELGLPDFFDRTINALIKHFESSAIFYPDGIKQIVLEIKSCSSFMFDYYERTRKPNSNHSLQTFHYLKAKNLDEGHIVYICKDDLRIIEFGVFLTDPSAEDAYRSDIAKMTDYFTKRELPPKEDLILFDKDTGRFTKNWKVEYSNYLEKLYGYKEPMNYSDEWQPRAAQWTRVLKRIVDEAKMTEANLKIIEDMKLVFGNFDEIVSIAKTLKIDIPEGGEDE